MKLEKWRANFDHEFGQQSITDMDWVSDDIQVFITKLLEKTISSYMKTLGDEKLSKETWEKIADINGKLLNNPDE